MRADQNASSTVAPENEDALPPDPVIEIYKRDVDRTLLRQSLQLSVTERFEELMELQRFAEALHQSR
jgi:hypothetical protein